MGDDERRRIGVATYYVKNEKEAEEAHLLARLAGYSRFAHLVFEAVDARLAELRQRFGPMLEAAQEERNG